MNKRKLEVRMVLQTSGLIVLTLLIVMGIALISYSRINENSLTSLNRQIIDQVATNVQTYIADLQRVSNLLNYDLNTQMYLNSKWNTAFERTEVTQKTAELLENIKLLRTDVSALILLSDNGDVLANESAGVLNPDYDFYSQPFYETAARGSLTLYRPHLQTYFNQNNQLVFSVVKAINSFDSGNKKGVVLMDLNMNNLRTICSNVKPGQKGYVMIVDTASSYIFHPEYAYIYKTATGSIESEHTLDDEIVTRVVMDGEVSFTNVSPNGRNQYITSKAVEGTDWVIIGVYPADELYSKQQSAAAIIVFGGLICIALGVLGTFFTAGMIFNPLRRLQNKMRLAEEGVLEISPEENRGDEIGELNESYNSMVVRINDLIQTTIKDEQDKRKIELRLLQAQINPHFLYNTLDSIVWMAQTKSDDVAIMADSLAKLFRLSLANGREIITIREELEHVAHYLTIQKMRYSKKFDYEIAVDDEILEMQTLKLTLQPIVENALYHGIKLKRQKGIILIHGFMQGNDIMLRVMDDGPGIPKEKLDTILLTENVSEKRLGGIGLKNVNERIRIYYGPKYGLTFSSEVDVGTVVEILIPAKKYTEGSNAAL